MDRHRKPLRVVLKPETKLRGEALPLDVQKVIVGEEHQQEWSSSLDQEDMKCRHIKEEQEELQISQERKQSQGLEETDVTKVPFAPVHVKNEDNEEDCGGSELTMKSVQDAHLQPDTDDETGDSSEPENNDSADWKETHVSASRCTTGEKDHEKRFGTSGHGERPFSCSVCKKSFTVSGSLQKHMRTHTGERPFSCTVCKKDFTERGHLQQHMRTHIRETI
ncbi:oocyte zinc finger protein XlCOF6-like isoform X2 [Etheostoma cragini]|uniref:oocyte zinc finger protein XlCOF6-like isoform X2 n=1 Tax=Etheostoma cragini TaxID=417921 RepID=UPI00155F34F6|nr:oocyte zinc finger protein XlCOF6-like isoform X2 [Etheostoma cragini]